MGTGQQAIGKESTQRTGAELPRSLSTSSPLPIAHCLLPNKANAAGLEPARACLRGTTLDHFAFASNGPLRSEKHAGMESNQQMTDLESAARTTRRADAWSGRGGNRTLLVPLARRDSLLGVRAPEAGRVDLQRLLTMAQGGLEPPRVVFHTTALPVELPHRLISAFVVRHLAFAQDQRMPIPECYQ